MESTRDTSMERTAYISFLLLGLAATIHGVAMPFLLDSFSITLGTGGLLFLARSIGYMAGSSSFPWFQARLGMKRHIALGTLLGAAALATLPISPFWSLLLVLAAVGGFGFSTIDVGFNAAVANLPPQRSRPAMHWLHFFFSVGALLGPALLARIYLATQRWQVLYWTGALFLLLLSGLWQRAKPPQGDTSRNGSDGAANPYGSVWFWMLLICMMLYCGAEISLTSWLTTYLVRELAAPVEYAAWSVSLFWGGLAAGRALAGWISTKFSVRTFLLILFGGSALGTAAAAGAAGIPAVMFSVFWTGLFFSAVFPSLILFGTAMFPHAASVVSGGMLTAASLGALILPTGLGYIGDWMSLAAGLWTLAALLMLSLFLTAVIPKRLLGQAGS